jgi:lipoprotein signal peptidase
LSLLFLAGTLGNALSLLLPPFVVVDYFGIYRPSIGAYVYANVADAYLIAAMVMIALIPGYLVLRRPHGRA